MIQNKTVILLKTHVWNDDLEKFVGKIYSQAVSGNIDFYILMHTDDGSLDNQVKSDLLKNITIKFTESDIKNVYPVGFYSMWLSNHWILMWFYQRYGHKYDYFWSMEYDVRISGNSLKIWSHDSKYDFLYVMGNNLNQNNKHRNHYVGGKLAAHEKYYGFLQLARYSKRALEYLDSCYVQGENGQDELITFSLLNRSGLNGSKAFLQKLIKGTWTWENKYVKSNRRLYEKFEAQNHDHDHDQVYIFHPVK